MDAATEALWAMEPPPEMSFRRKKAEQVVTGLERQINYHLLKLLAFDAAPETREHWRTELDEWLSQVAVIRLKPENKPIPARAAYEWLFDEPFGGSEEQNVAIMIRFLERRGLRRNGASAAEVAARLRALHEALAERVARGDAGADLLAAL
jgi:hypothetical protein